MDIGSVAKQTGLAPSTLRYYEKIGLIKSNGRNGLRRTFPTAVIQQLKFIILLKNNQLSLDEIRRMTEAGVVDRAFLLEKVKKLQENIEQLTLVCDTLEHIAHCPENNHFDCPAFQRLLEKCKDK